MRLFLAGLESCVRGQYILDIPNDVYILTSFYYTDDKTIQKFIDSVGVENILLDSGAFTFRMNGSKKENIEQYTDRYIEFINKYNIKYFFEMDIDMTAGDLPHVEQLRKKIEQGTGKKCIPVWHKTRGIQKWYDIVNDYDYIAIGGITADLDNKFTSILKRMITYANKHNTKVHGLGYNRRDMTEYGFYSCDATSWQGGKYGFIWSFDPKVGYPTHTKSETHKKRIISEKQKIVYRLNFEVWIKYQKYLRKKGYWHE